MGRNHQLLCSLLFAGAVSGCGSTEVAGESAGQGAARLSDACEVRPPFTGHFEPELQWAWSGSEVMPGHVQVMMTPVVIDVNGDKTPDLVFSTFAGADYDKDGVLRAISGEDGHELWTVTDATARVKPAASIAAGDIDGDGKVEICAIPENGRGIICFENDGAFKFRSAPGDYDYNEWGGPSLADLDGDGSVEILDGNRVYSHTGELLWTGSDGMGGALYTGPVSFAADIDQDGLQEVVNDRAIYRHDGTLKCANTSIPHGFAGVANFDEDSAAEIVVSGSGKVSLLDDDCSLLWSVDVPGGGHGGPPNIADFDGDGVPEIGLPGETAYSVLESDGSLKWTFPIQDQSSGRTGSTSFDFEDDGKLEIVFADETKLRIFDAATGVLRWQTSNSSATTHENPVIADVDGNGSANLVVVSNDHAYAGSHGIRVFHDRLEGWAETRRVWNQHAYSVTNIHDDGTVPAHPAAHWLQPRLNAFHANVSGYLGDGPNPYAASDLTVSDLTFACGTEGSLKVSARVRNQGAAASPAGVKVAFYRLDPTTGSSLLGVSVLPGALAVGEYAFVSLALTSTPEATRISAVVDDDGAGAGADTECREDNNSTQGLVDLSCSVPVSNQPPVALCRDVTVNANASCQGTASVDKGSYDPDNGPSPLVITQSPNTALGLGAHPVTLTASDGQASAQCVGKVTVVDATPPTITCPLSVDIKVGSILGIAVQYAVSASDTCGPATFTCSHPPGTIFLPGLTPVTCTARDAANNTATCHFGIRISLGVTLPF